jgi:hypothetical protein
MQCHPCRAVTSSFNQSMRALGKQQWHTMSAHKHAKHTRIDTAGSTPAIHKQRKHDGWSALVCSCLHAHAYGYNCSTPVAVRSATVLALPKHTGTPHALQNIHEACRKACTCVAGTPAGANSFPAGGLHPEPAHAAPTHRPLRLCVAQHEAYRQVHMCMLLRSLRSTASTGC